MDTNQLPSFEIPKGQNRENDPSVRALSPEVDSTMSIEATKEILPSPSSSATATPSTPAHPALSAQHLSGVPVQTVAISSDDSHLIADDVDVIEKEWVDRAKKIIAITSQDPYQESKEISKLKASYLKKRFDKDLPSGPQEVMQK